MPLIQVKKNGMNSHDINECDGAAFVANYIGETNDIIIVNPEVGVFMTIEEAPDGDTYLSMVDAEHIDTRLENIREADIKQIIAEEI